MEVGNFQGFRVFDFGSYTKIQSFKNSEMFSRLVNFKGFVFFKEVQNFQRSPRVFDFGSYTEIENSENSEIFSKTCKLQGMCFISGS